VKKTGGSAGISQLEKRGTGTPTRRLGGDPRTMRQDGKKAKRGGRRAVGLKARHFRLLPPAKGPRPGTVLAQRGPSLVGGKRHRHSIWGGGVQISFLTEDGKNSAFRHWNHSGRGKVLNGPAGGCKGVGTS